MKSARKLISVGILILVVCASPTTIAQQENGGEGGSDVQQALNELKNTAPVDRTEAREAVEELGNSAVQPLIEQVKNPGPDTGANYVTNCVIALGNLGDTAATNVLVDALDNSERQVAYTAARALGKIYSGDTSGGQARKVNGALAATMYRHYPRPLSLGAAIALAQINDIGQNPTRRNLEGDLYPAVTQWVAENPDRLPPLADQNWRLLLQTMIISPQAERRNQAAELLVGKKPLQAVEAIVEILRGEHADIPDERWSDLAELLDDITGVSVPPDGNQQERLDNWTQQWQRELKKRTGEEFRNYCWKMLDEKITALRRNPTEEAKKKVETYKDILLSQMDSPDAIPRSASRTATTLLRKPLQLKEKVHNALQKLGPDTPAYQKIGQLAQIRSVTKQDAGPPVVRLFAPQLVELAREVDNADVEAMMSTILTKMSEIPVDLSKQDALQRWLELFRKKYPELADL